MSDTTESRAESAPRPPTVSELAAMSDAELAERHDAAVAWSRRTGEPASDIYLGELGRRMRELRDERILRFVVADLVLSAAVLVVGLAAIMIAL
jgi:hypothetical protein